MCVKWNLNLFSFDIRINKGFLFLCDYFSAKLWCQLFGLSTNLVVCYIYWTFFTWLTKSHIYCLIWLFHSFIALCILFNCCSVWLHCTMLIHTLWAKKQDTKLLPITSPNINRFSKFFHCWTLSMFKNRNSWGVSEANCYARLSHSNTALK